MTSPTNFAGIPALVMAGGRTSEEFAAAAGVPVEPGARALADIHGRPMVDYVLRALQAAPTVGPVVLVAPTGFPRQAAATAQLAGDGTLVDNLRLGISHCPEAPFALFVTADVPFLTPEAVEDFLNRGRGAIDAGADLCYSAIPREACEKSYPGMKRTWLKTPIGVLTGGNVVLQRTAMFETEAEMIQRAYLQRKNPMFLAQLIGPGNVLKWAMGRLRVEDIEAGASRVLGARCRLLVTPYAELGTDVDRPEDILLARQLISAQ